MLCGLTDGNCFFYSFEVHGTADLEKGITKAISLYKARKVALLGFEMARRELMLTDKTLRLQVAGGKDNNFYNVYSNVLSPGSPLLTIEVQAKNLDYTSFYESVLLSKSFIDGLEQAPMIFYNRRRAATLAKPKLKLIKCDKNIDKC